MKDILNYNKKQNKEDVKICNLLMEIINKNLKFTENKIWHRHPVWFIEGNPVVGYSKLKAGVRLLFWSGISFKESLLEAGSGKFKDASMTYTSLSEVKPVDIKRWLKKSEEIQWDYKNIVKRKGLLLKLK